MQIHLDFRSGIPIYLQLVDQVRHSISKGELAPGDQLPTVRQLAADLRVNFNTVARAYRILDEAGVISTQHGRGTYILEPSQEVDEEELRKKTFESLTRQYLSEVQHLGFERDEVQKMLRQIFDNFDIKGKSS